MPKNKYPNSIADNFKCQIIFNDFKYRSVNHAFLSELYRDKGLTDVFRRIKYTSDMLALAEHIKHDIEPDDRTALITEIRIQKFFQNETIRYQLMSLENATKDWKRVQEALADQPYTQGDLFWTTP